MNPYDDKWLRDEVIYLHYLWHQGPPQNPNPNPQKRPRPFNQNPTNKCKRLAASGSDPPPKPDHGLDWSTLLDPPPPSSPGWPKPKSEPDHHQTQPVSVEDQARFASLQMRSRVLESCKEFFNKRGVDDEESNDDDDDGEEGGVDKFFMGIFVNNSELRGYYEENHNEGEFLCLVCGGIGENVGKKFKGCIGLVQHCMSISKTKRRKGHRAFGLVVCEVLGWDIDRLPVISLKGEPLSRRLANLKESQGTSKGDDPDKYGENIETENLEVEVKEGASNCLDKEDDLNVILGTVESVNPDGSESVEKEVSAIDHSNGGLMICENSLKEDDTNKNVENFEISGVEQNKEAVNDLAFGVSQITSTEWPCIEPINESSSTTMGWPIFKPCTAPVTHVVPAEEQIRLNKLQLQQNVFEACKQFFSTTAGSDSDDNDNEADDEDDNEADGEDEEELIDGSSKEFNFFLKLFVENNELRTYYETNCRGGDFCCLVCCGIGKKVWRTFKDCLGLLQHSTAISKTQKKRAHRAFGLVICKVLGWDSGSLPSIVLKGEPLSRSLEELSQCQLDGKAGCNKDEPDTPDKRDSESASEEDLDSFQNNSMLMCSENTVNEEPRKDSTLQNRTLNIATTGDKALSSLVEGSSVHELEEDRSQSVKEVSESRNSPNGECQHCI